MTMSIKMVDLKAQFREIQHRVETDFAEIHANSSYIGGPAVAAFEAEFAAFLGVRRVVGVGSGTDALRLALLALGVGPGDEVVTVPMTFVATAEAIVQTGARPAFVDVDPVTGNMSVAALKRYLEAGNFASPSGPKAVVPVHLYGMPAPMTEIREVAEANGLKVVEDACQAHGARMNIGGGWIRVGSLGAAGCFSFYPGKNLGAWGEAGAVATNDDKLADEVACLRDHGRISHYAHSDYGYNARLDALQAAVLRAKLERLDRWNARRRRLAALYSELLPNQGLKLPHEPEGLESCYHLFVIRSANREAIRTALLERQIECGIHYPMPLHLQPACSELGYSKGDFPVCESMAETVLSLPMHPHLTDRQVEFVAEAVRSAAARF
jgi:dTDP-4-amino-4,6-dideoxygalactose transaminase